MPNYMKKKSLLKLNYPFEYSESIKKGLHVAIKILCFVSPWNRLSFLGGWSIG